MILTTDCRCSPGHGNSSLQTSLSVGADSCAETLAVATNIAAASVVNTLGKVGLERNLGPTPPEHLGLEDPTLLGRPLLSVGVEGTRVLQYRGDNVTTTTTTSTWKVEALGQ